MHVVHSRTSLPSWVHRFQTRRHKSFGGSQCSDVKNDIEELLRTNGGVIRRADHPDLRRRLDGLRYRKVLDSPLPGILCAPGATDDFSGSVRAGWLWAGPDSVVVGRAAAKLTFWPEADVSTYEFAIPRDHSAQQARWKLSHREIPSELIWHRGRLQVASPALSAIDLAAGPDGGDVIDRALRSRTTTIAMLRKALELTPARDGNRLRAELLHDSRDSPWSESERALHQLLRKNGIRGWTTNHWIDLPNLLPQTGAFVDVLFKKQRVALEVDGYEFHSDRDAFEKDRRRRNELVLAGHLVLNFTWRQITEDPDWVLGCIRRALALA